jgi:histidyl-tRNA synthetase
MGKENPAFRAPRGTNDLLPPQAAEWTDAARAGLEMFARAGYQQIETPMFEHTEVFERGVGEATEVVNKQMYTFTDQGGRSLTLRPEGTAPTVRAMLEHGLERGGLPVKLSYYGPMFRQERPQKGRYRQFWQIGIEAIGTDDPRVDAEVIELGKRFIAEVATDPTLLLNSIGHPDPSCRQGYIALLVEFLEKNSDALAPEDRERVRTNPLRTFDSKESKTIEVMAGAPLIIDHLCDACRKHFEQVRSLLDDIGIAYEVEPRLVRGLDYYTRTAFEFVSGGLGAQNAVGGGGRYDGLSEALGGPPLPGIGFALGFDRVMLARGERTETRPGIDAYIVALGEEPAREAFKIVTSLRAASLGAELDLAGRSMKGQMKDAVRSGARYAVIIGESELAAGEATVKDLGTSEQERVPLGDLERRLRT